MKLSSLVLILVGSASRVLFFKILFQYYLKNNNNNILSSEMNSDSCPSEIPDTQLPFSQSQSQVTYAKVGRNKHLYSGMIFFNWTHGKDKPFEWHSKDEFSEKEIRSEWLKFQMLPKSRAMLLKSLKSFPDIRHSFFAKVEDGMFEINFI